MPGLRATIDPPATTLRASRRRLSVGEDERDIDDTLRRELRAVRHDVDAEMRRELRADPRLRVGNMGSSPARGWAATLLCAAAVAAVMAAVVMATQ